MPQPRKYEDAATKQRAYRARKQVEQLQQRANKTPGYPKWRKAIRDAHTILNATYEEIHYWMQERSERWQESDRAAEIESDRDQLQEIIESLENLYLWKPSNHP